MFAASAYKLLKLIDPACGSGAYLVGMLQELFQILKLLDTAGKLETPNIAYEAKLKIIQNNLYGVDLDEFAVHIARLRLWLSLSIDNPMLTPEPLPNLDYKIECGDSLSELVRTEFVGIEDKDINEFIEMKEHYLNMHSIDKDAYGEKIEKIREHFRICRGRVKGSIIGGVAPSEYLSKLEHGNQSTPPIIRERLDGYLTSHLVDSELLRADAFDAFLADRQQRLLTLIEQATGKPAYVGDVVEEGEDMEVDQDTVEAQLTLAEA